MTKFIRFISSRKSWALPYLLFSIVFVIVPLLLIVVYAFTDDAGHLTLENFHKFFKHPEAVNTFVYSIGNFLEKFKTASNPEICGENPITNREVPTNVWGHSVAGGFLSFYFCIRKFKTL